jgi:hypothetical protein
MRQITKPGVYRGTIVAIRQLHLAVEVDLNITHGPETGLLTTFVPDYRYPVGIKDVGERVYIILEKRSDNFSVTSIEKRP